MKYYSTNNRNISISFKEAVLKGIADDGGLFMPEHIPSLSQNFIKKISDFSFNEIAFEAARNFIEEIPEKDLKKIIKDAFYFDSPLVQLDESLYILELFHGPTLAFKDFGARFMARVISYFLKDSDTEVTILVATSGDTGSAVANGFYDIKGINVVLLYPSGKVSEIQEKQLTTLDKNITALEVLGTFDDCQRMVKQAFLDKNLKEKLVLSSANSINVARLIPQSFYYFYAYSRLKDKSKPVVFSVPSGNFGNLTGGLFAKKMGLPVYKFIAALNLNDVFYKYLLNGRMEPKPSVKTLSNAMDVGNPSNFARIESLYEKDIKKIKEDICGFSFSDDETIEGIKEIYNKYRYFIDPHGSVGYLAAKKFSEKNHNNNTVILETAHPAKFKDTVEKAINQATELPESLASALAKEKKSIKIPNNFEAFKEYLLNK